LLNAKAVISLLRIKYLSDKGDAIINLAWSIVSGATGYKIYYSQNEINASNLGSTPSVQVSNASGRVSGLTNNTLYYFAITAVKDGVEGSQSAMVLGIIYFISCCSANWIPS
jgi:hypothetical protein